jgi:hypothetical protein
MNEEKKAFLDPITEDFQQLINEFKIKHNIEMEFLGTFLFISNSDSKLRAGSVLGEFTSLEYLEGAATSLMLHTGLRHELTKKSLQYLYSLIVSVDEISNDLSSTDLLKDMLGDLSDN